MDKYLTSHLPFCSERTVEIRETWSENVHGLDNLTLAINSLDDHVQVRNKNEV